MLSDAVDKKATEAIDASSARARNTAQNFVDSAISKTRKRLFDLRVAMRNRPPWFVRWRRYRALLLAGSFAAAALLALQLGNESFLSPGCLPIGTDAQAPPTENKRMGNSHQSIGNRHQSTGNNHQSMENSHQSIGNSHQSIGNSHQSIGNTATGGVNADRDIKSMPGDHEGVNGDRDIKSMLGEGGGETGAAGDGDLYKARGGGRSLGSAGAYRAGDAPLPHPEESLDLRVASGCRVFWTRDRLDHLKDGFGVNSVRRPWGAECVGRAVSAHVNGRRFEPPVVSGENGTVVTVAPVGAAAGARGAAQVEDESRGYCVVMVAWPGDLSVSAIGDGSRVFVIAPHVGTTTPAELARTREILAASGAPSGDGATMDDDDDGDQVNGGAGDDDAASEDVGGWARYVGESLPGATLAVTATGRGSFAFVDVRGWELAAVRVSAPRAAVHLRDVRLGSVHITASQRGVFDVTTDQRTAGSVTASDFAVSARSVNTSRSAENAAESNAAENAAAPVTTSFSAADTYSKLGSPPDPGEPVLAVEVFLREGAATVRVNPASLAEGTLNATAAAEHLDLAATDAAGLLPRANGTAAEPLGASLRGEVAFPAAMRANGVFLEMHRATSSGTTAGSAAAEAAARLVGGAELAGAAGNASSAVPQQSTAVSQAMGAAVVARLARLDASYSSADTSSFLRAYATVELPRFVLMSPGAPQYVLTRFGKTFYDAIGIPYLAVLSFGLLVPKTSLMYLMPERALCEFALTSSAEAACGLVPGSAALEYVTGTSGRNGSATGTDTPLLENSFVRSRWACRVSGGTEVSHAGSLERQFPAIYDALVPGVVAANDGVEPRERFLFTNVLFTDRERASLLASMNNQTRTPTVKPFDLFDDRVLTAMVFLSGSLAVFVSLSLMWLAWALYDHSMERFRLQLLIQDGDMVRNCLELIASSNRMWHEMERLDPKLAEANDNSRGALDFDDQLDLARVGVRTMARETAVADLTSRWFWRSCSRFASLKKWSPDLQKLLDATPRTGATNHAFNELCRLQPIAHEVCVKLHKTKRFTFLPFIFEFVAASRRPEGEDVPVDAALFHELWHPTLLWELLVVAALLLLVYGPVALLFVPGNELRRTSLAYLEAWFEGAMQGLQGPLVIAAGAASLVIAIFAIMFVSMKTGYVPPKVEKTNKAARPAASSGSTSTSSSTTSREGPTSIPELRFKKKSKGKSQSQNIELQDVERRHGDAAGTPALSNPESNGAPCQAWSDETRDGAHGDDEGTAGTRSFEAAGAKEDVAIVIPIGDDGKPKWPEPKFEPWNTWGEVARRYFVIFASFIVMLCTALSTWYVAMVASWTLLGTFIAPARAAPFATAVVGITAHVTTLTGYLTRFQNDVFARLRVAMSEINASYEMLETVKSSPLGRAATTAVLQSGVGDAAMAAAKNKVSAEMDVGKLDGPGASHEGHGSGEGDFVAQVVDAAGSAARSGVDGALDEAARRAHRAKDERVNALRKAEAGVMAEVEMRVEDAGADVEAKIKRAKADVDPTEHAEKLEQALLAQHPGLASRFARAEKTIAAVAGASAAFPGELISEEEVRLWMARNGISTRHIVMALIWSTTVLVAILAFIFMGLYALADAEQTLDSLISSFLTAFATLTVNASQRKDPERRLQRVTAVLVRAYRASRRNREASTFAMDDSLLDVLANAKARKAMDKTATAQLGEKEKRE